MHINWLIVLASILVGFTVGLTGMGGGALMTPILLIFFGINPTTAVSSDLVAAMVMKPVGGGVHVRRGTVRWELVKWLCIGSIPAAFAGVLVLHASGDSDTVENTTKIFLGVTLTASILIGAVPAVYVGARASSKAPDGLIRPALVFVLLASALKLLDVSTGVLGLVLLAVVLVGPPAWGAVDATIHPQSSWDVA